MLPVQISIVTTPVRSQRYPSEELKKMSVVDKVIIVTGAGSGIGKATALLLGAEKSKVALFDINPSIFDIEAQIKASGGSAIAIKVDVSSSAEVDAATKAVVDAFGPIDGMSTQWTTKSRLHFQQLTTLLNQGGANLAGVSGTGTVNLEQETDEGWDRVIRINLGGVKNALRAQLQHRNPKGASIVNASSIGARIGSPGNAAYSASKAAVSGLTKSVAREMGPHGVRVNAIAPYVLVTRLLTCSHYGMASNYGF